MEIARSRAEGACARLSTRATKRRRRHGDGRVLHVNFPTSARRKACMYRYDDALNVQLEEFEVARAFDGNVRSREVQNGTLQDCHQNSNQNANERTLESSTHTANRPATCLRLAARIKEEDARKSICCTCPHGAHCREARWTRRAVKERIDGSQVQSRVERRLKRLPGKSNWISETQFAAFRS